jgi:hypothetical protein
LTISAPPYGTWEARIDYVFHSKLARAKSARVIRSVPGYTWPSDHGALLVTLAPLRRHPLTPYGLAKASASPARAWANWLFLPCLTRV